YREAVARTCTEEGFVAHWHLGRFVLWSLPRPYRAQRGRATRALSCQGAPCPPEIMLMGGRWEGAYPLRERHVAARLEERGVAVDHAPSPRGVVQDRPAWEAAFDRRQRPVWVNWRLAATSIQGTGPGRARAGGGSARPAQRVAPHGAARHRGCA